MKRQPRTLPILNIKKRKRKDFCDYNVDDFEIEGYNPHKVLKMDMAV